MHLAQTYYGWPSGQSTHRTHWKNSQNLPSQSDNACNSAIHVRDTFKTHFCSPVGQVEWQYANQTV